MTIASLTPATIKTANAHQAVMSALARASERTGADFNYLLRTAERESSLNPLAKSKSSSATGLFQFIEQTWLRTVKEHGAKHGLAREAALIQKTASGELTTASAADREAILALRGDPAIASLMAGELTNDSRAHLERRLGRTVSSGELYLAHFLGADGAARFLTAEKLAPNGHAAQAFPKAAAANRSIFYDETGKARTFSEVSARLTSRHEAAGSPIALPPIDDRADPQVATIEPSASTAAFTTRFANSALRLTPEVLTILASLDPVPRAGHEARAYRVADRLETPR